MKKLVMIIVMAMIVTVFLPVVALADYDGITVTGDWEVEYEVDDFTVGASGGTGILRLKVKNNTPDIMHYVSISYATGRESASHQTRRVTIAPTRDRILEFSIDITAADAGLGLQLWVAMSTRGEDDVDGIGVKNGVMFGPVATYDATLDINTGTATINQGESVAINFGGANTGNKSVDIKVYDQTGAQIFETDDMDILYLGHKSYTPSTTTTYRFRTEVYRLGTDRLEKEVMSNYLTITVIEPTPAPTATPTPTPAPEVTPEPATETTPEPSPEVVEEETDVTLDSELEEEAMSAEEEANEELLVVGTDNESTPTNSNNTLWIVIISLLFVVVLLIIGLTVYIAKGKKSSPT